MRVWTRSDSMLYALGGDARRMNAQVRRQNSRLGHERATRRERGATARVNARAAAATSATTGGPTSDPGSPPCFQYQYPAALQRRLAFRAAHITPQAPRGRPSFPSDARRASSSSPAADACRRHADPVTLTRLQRLLCPFGHRLEPFLSHRYDISAVWARGSGFREANPRSTTSYGWTMTPMPGGQSYSLPNDARVLAVDRSIDVRGSNSRPIKVLDA